MQKRIKFVTDKNTGKIVAGATIQVLLYPGGGAATIYSDNGVTQIPSTLTSDADGRYEYYAANGHYTELITTSAGLQPAINDIIFDDSLTTNQQFVVATGTGDAMVVTAFATGYTLADGDEIRVRAPGANTVTNPTITLPGVGVLTVFKLGGDALNTGDIKGSGHEIHLRYRTAPARIELVGPDAFLHLHAGSIAESVPAALRRILHSDQFSSEANFLAALDTAAAGSGTIGFAARNIRLEASPIIQGIEFGDNMVLSSNVDNTGCTFGADDGTGILKLNLFRKDIVAGLQIVGQLGFEGRMAGGGTTTYAVVRGSQVVNTDGAPQGRVSVYTVNGTETLAERVQIAPDGDLTLITGDLILTPGIITTGGAVALSLRTSGGAQVSIEHVAAVDRRLTLQGSSGGNPTISTSAGNVEIAKPLVLSANPCWIIANESDTDPTTTELDASDSFAWYMKNNKLVVAVNITGTINYLSIDLDGADTSWSWSAVAP